VESASLVARKIGFRPPPANHVLGLRNSARRVSCNFVYTTQLNKCTDTINEKIGIGPHGVDYLLYTGYGISDTRAKLLLLAERTSMFFAIETSTTYGTRHTCHPTFHGAWSGCRIFAHGTRNCQSLEQRIEDFLDHLEDVLAQMTPEEFDNFKRAALRK